MRRCGWKIRRSPLNQRISTSTGRASNATKHHVHLFFVFTYASTLIEGIFPLLKLLSPLENRRQYVDPQGVSSAI